MSAGSSQPSPDIVVSQCGHCPARFLPRPGPCPRCGSTEISPRSVPPDGSVLAATELLAPATGWTAPHRIALVELDAGVRVLGVVDGPLPARGARIRIVRDHDLYRVAAARP